MKLWQTLLAKCLPLCPKPYPPTISSPKKQTLTMPKCHYPQFGTILDTTPLGSLDAAYLLPQRSLTPQRKYDFANGENQSTSPEARGL